MSRLTKHFYEFGPFRLDVKERLLLREGETVPLTPKAFDMLLALVENSGHLVEKNELMQRLWPDSFVEEGSLAQNISLLRKALGESESQKFIETVPRRGYRFVARVLSKPEQIADRTIKSIAVLPFKSLGVDGGDEYLGIGIAETLTTRLSSLNLLIVRPTSAVLICILLPHMIAFNESNSPGAGKHHSSNLPFLCCFLSLIRAEVSTFQFSEQ